MRLSLAEWRFFSGHFFVSLRVWISLCERGFFDWKRQFIIDLKVSEPNWGFYCVSGRVAQYLLHTRQSNYLLKFWKVPWFQYVCFTSLILNFNYISVCGKNPTQIDREWEKMHFHLKIFDGKCLSFEEPRLIIESRHNFDVHTKRGGSCSWGPRNWPACERAP